MKTTVKIITGYIEQPMVRPKGGRSATRASSIKAAAAERLAGLMGGEKVGFGTGAENTDPLKAGYLTPAARIAILRNRAESYELRIARAMTDPDVSATEVEYLIQALTSKYDDAVSEIISIVKDMNQDQDA